MDVLARITIQKDSLNPEDAIVNTLAYNRTGDPDDADFDNLRDHIADFYNVAPAAAIDPISEYLSGTVLTSASEDHMIEFYEIAHPFVNLGSPIAVREFAIPTVTLDSTVNLPDEVASCLSFHAGLGTQPEVTPLPPTGPEGDVHPRARRRGRIFIGPLNATATDTGSAVIPRPSDVFRADVVKSAAEHLSADAAVDGWLWSVWSRADDILRFVVGGWVDDAWDTQRRRGVSATTRTTFTV